MATMVPTRPEKDSQHGERIAFEAFEKSLPNDWLVLYARRLLRLIDERSPAWQGEADLVIFHPRRGLIVLEVKGGVEVGRDRNGWYSIDHSGRRHDIKDPGRQAQTCSHKLDEHLRQQKWFATNRCRIPFTFGVVLPHVTVRGDLGPALPRAIILDDQDLSDPKAALLRLFDAQGMPDRELPQGTARAFLDAMAPIVDLAPSLSNRIDRDAKELVRLTDRQIELLRALRDCHRVSVKGVAGSGKTLLAIEKAGQLARAGKKVLFLCFNRPLAQHLSSLAVEFPVKTFHEFCHDMAKAADLDFKVPSDASEMSHFFDEVAPERLMDAASLLEDERFDAILVDEGQDFRELWWPAIENLLRDQAESLLYVFWDPNQNLYDRGPEGLSEMVPYRLDQNCRNTARIARFSGAYVDLDPEVIDSAPEGLEVGEYRVADDKAMVHAVRKLLHQYVNEEKIPSDRVVVLTPRTVKASPVWQQNKLGNITLVDLDTQPAPGQVRMASIKHFKGLEADVIILADVVRTSRNCGPKDLYVATSRARLVLAVVSREG